MFADSITYNCSRCKFPNMEGHKIKCNLCLKATHLNCMTGLDEALVTLANQLDESKKMLLSKALEGTLSYYCDKCKPTVTTALAYHMEREQSKQDQEILENGKIDGRNSEEHLEGVNLKETQSSFFREEVENDNDNENKNLTNKINEDTLLVNRKEELEVKKSPKVQKEITCKYHIKGICKYREEQCIFAHPNLCKNQPVSEQYPRKISTDDCSLNNNKQKKEGICSTTEAEKREKTNPTSTANKIHTAKICK